MLSCHSFCEYVLFLISSVIHALMALCQYHFRKCLSFWWQLY